MEQNGILMVSEVRNLSLDVGVLLELCDSKKNRDAYALYSLLRIGTIPLDDYPEVLNIRKDKVLELFDILIGMGLVVLSEDNKIVTKKYLPEEYDG